MAIPIISRFLKKRTSHKKAKPQRNFLVLEKRQKFVLGAGTISLAFFFSSFFLPQLGLATAIILSVIADLFLWWGVHSEMDGKVYFQSFILPCLFVIAVGVFSLLIPARIITHTILTILFAIGLYSIFLSENIFLVATQRTIPLVSSARIISAILMLLIYFFLADAIFSLRAAFLITIPLLFFVSLFINGHAIWSYSLENKREDIVWVVIISWCLTELGSALWFWPATPTITALFLAVMLYFFTGLSHYWFDRRLFKNIFLEYAWIGVMALFLLITLTTWHG